MYIRDALIALAADSIDIYENIKAYHLLCSDIVSDDIETHDCLAKQIDTDDIEAWTALNTLVERGLDQHNMGDRAVRNNPCPESFKVGDKIVYGKDSDYEGETGEVIKITGCITTVKHVSGRIESFYNDITADYFSKLPSDKNEESDYKQLIYPEETSNI